ncbi:MAG: methyltransferase domain-containing protein [Pseudomonadales bacterium]|jgi:tRNA G46 methylase TrmB|nr:methyltransferase domain-containing protein [Pseudomonadales bacterium]
MSGASVMIGNSRRIVGAQRGPHADLERRIARHRDVPFQRPIASHTAAAFAALVDRLDSSRPLVLDAGCGTGESSVRLAGRHPDALVIGVDKSAHRLRPVLAGGGCASRVHLVRADLQDFWRLARAAGLRLAAHYLLYPNPWPKAVHLQRRWHGHPVFPDLLALGGALELRTNWSVYAEEFAAGLACFGFEASMERLDAESAGSPLTPFERKYLASGQRCLRVRADLDTAGALA